MIQVLNVIKEEFKFQKSYSLAVIEEVVLVRVLLRLLLFSIFNGVYLYNFRELFCGLFFSVVQVLVEFMIYRLRKLLLVEELRQVGLYFSFDILGFFEQLSQVLGRVSGILFLGFVGSGKIICWQSLFKIQNRLVVMEDVLIQGFQYVEIIYLYFSVFSFQEFLGWLEGFYWYYGIFFRLFRVVFQSKIVGLKGQVQESVGIQYWIICDGVFSVVWLDFIICFLGEFFQFSFFNGQQIKRFFDIFFLMEVGDVIGMFFIVVGRCVLVWCGGEQIWQGMFSILMVVLFYEYRLRFQIVIEFNRLVEVLVFVTFRFFISQGVSFLLQVYGQQVVCLGVVEVISLVRILRCLFDFYLYIDEEETVYILGEGKGKGRVGLKEMGF